MRSFIITIAFFFSLVVTTNVQAQATDTLRSNLRVVANTSAKAGEEHAEEMDYLITKSDGIIKFQHLDGELSYAVRLTEVLSVEEFHQVKIVKWDTDGTEEVLLMYFEGRLVSCSVEEINGVSTFYVFNDNIKS
jgi:hypothetical protein